MLPDIETALKEIVETIAIESNFAINHPKYGKFGLVRDAVEQFSQLPPQLQSQYLRSQLQNLIYSTYYNGSIHQPEESDRDLNVENNTIMGIDSEFFDRLHDSNRGEGYFDPGWRIQNWVGEHTLSVKKGEISLHINPHLHLHPESLAGLQQVGEFIPDRYTVPVLMPKNRIMPGFYIAIGNEGIVSKADGVIVTRVYFHLTPDGSVAVMRELTEGLNRESLPFSFKVLYDRQEYGRYDSGVLYFAKDDYPAIKPLLEGIYDQTEEHFRPEVPLFTKKLAPGMGLAEEQIESLPGGESFGLNRALLIARGLVSAWEEGDESPQGRLDRIVAEFNARGISLATPYLNPGEEDIYTR
jgi:HopA1 effector protein family